MNEVRELVEYLREQGVDRFTVGDISIEFGIREVGTAAALPADITPEAREEELGRIKDRMKQLSESSDSDMFWSV